jgi:hypothetical protein
MQDSFPGTDSLVLAAPFQQPLPNLSPIQADLDRMTELAALVCQVPIAILSLVEGTQQWVRSQWGLDEPVPHRETVCMPEPAAGSRLVEMSGARLDTWLAQHTWLTPDVRHCTAYKLITAGGHTLGTLSVLNREARSLGPMKKQKSVGCTSQKRISGLFSKTRRGSCACMIWRVRC